MSCSIGLSHWVEKVVKARKPHRCATCLTQIPKGVEYARGVGFVDGSAYTWKEHIECRLVGTAYINESWECTYGPDEVYEYLNELRYNGLWPDEAHAIVAMRVGVMVHDDGVADARA